jgi:hypothetical protein
MLQNVPNVGVRALQFGEQNVFGFAELRANGIFDGEENRVRFGSRVAGSPFHHGYRLVVGKCVVHSQ